MSHLLKSLRLIMLVILIALPLIGGDCGIIPNEGEGEGEGPALATVTVSGTPTLQVGARQKFTADSSDDDDTIFTWEDGDDEAFATVFDDGTVLGIAEGVTTIIATGNASGASGSAHLTVVPADTNIFIWDGESGYTGDNGSLNTSNPFRGNGCFEAELLPGVTPILLLDGYPSDDADLSVLNDADTEENDGQLWFFCRVDEDDIGKTFTIQLSAWPNYSEKVSVDSYVDDLTLDTSWKLVKIPFEELEKIGVEGEEDYRLEKIQRILFSGPGTGDGLTVYIDEIWAVSEAEFDPESFPLMGAISDEHGVTTGAASFGTVEASGTGTKEISFPVTLTNIGSGTLTITGISITGDNADEFSVSTAGFSIDPNGGTYELTITFAPDVLGTDVFGEKTASLVLTYDPTVPTPMGSSTTIPLSGTVEASAISLSSDTFDFGSVPVGLSATHTLTVSNPGNKDLVVTSIAATDASFEVVTPSLFPLTIPKDGGDEEVNIAFSPTAATAITDTLTIESDANDSETITVALSATGLSSGLPGSLAVDYDSITSSTVTLSWPELSTAGSVRVYVGPEPPSVADGVLDPQRLISTEGNVFSYTVENLAPAVDAFFHVEVLDAEDAVISQGNTHARTIGGPRATLDGVVREVHMVAPHILCLVLTNEHVHSFAESSNNHDQGIEEVVGDTGVDFQTGLWTVTRSDDTDISVTEVYRKSSPVGQYYYDVGYGAQTWNNFLDLDHEIYLVLAEEVGSPEILTVTGPTVDYEFMTQEFVEESRQAAVDILLPFSDNYLETTVIQVNQVGYCPRATERWAYVSGWMGDGGPLSLDNFPENAQVLLEPIDPMETRQTTEVMVEGVPVSDIPITLRSELDEDSGTEVRQIDLAGVPAAEGTVYRVRIPGVGVSWPTQVSETAVFKSFYTIARGLFHNRWGGDLRSDLTEWSRPADHPTVYAAESDDPWHMFSEDTPRIGEFSLSGGHHDAGDFDIRIFHGLVGEVLLNAYEANAEALTDGQLTIPESGNVIPDLLDEALWNIAAWEQLQEEDGEEEGGVRIGVESYRHPNGIYLAHEDPLAYWTYSVNANHTTRVAGLFAQAARLVAPYDASKSAELLTRAIAAYDYAVAAGVTESIGGPIIYAAGELFRVTGETAYKEMVLDTWEAHRPEWDSVPTMWSTEIPWTSTYESDVQPIVPDHIVGYLGSAEVVSEHFDGYSDVLLSEIASAGQGLESRYAHRNMRTYSPDWGRGTAVGQHLRGLYPALQLLELTEAQKEATLNAISLSADYVLGCNPLGRSWMSGLGSRPPQGALHLDSLVFVAQGMPPIPGLPVFGPSESIPVNSYYAYSMRLSYPAYAERPILRRYADVHVVTRSNEFTVWESQAEQARLFALLVTPGMMPPESWLPGGTEHRNSLAPREGVVAGP
ncbi:choice-of-anchor D domain-containing protein [Candidatus Hydrogenedentota bacterium]